jgi:hypothetical protein
MMKIKDGFIMKDVAGSKVVLPLGERQFDVNGIITFNDVGAEVFNMLDGTNSIEEIATKIAKDYDVSYEIVEADVNELIEKMRANGLIED